jgi:hypothetical protein
MNPETKARIIQLKACFGLEYLHFYRYGSAARPGQLHCKYITNPNDFITEDELDLQFIMNFLSKQQGKVFFDDVGEECIGMDGLKAKYLIFRLAGL